MDTTERHTPEVYKNPEEVRQILLDRFTRYLDDLGGPTLSSQKHTEGTLSQEVEPPNSSRLAVIVSLFEEDDSMLATKMFSHSLENLLAQAKDAGLDLDLFVVANNGGGSTETIGRLMRNQVRSLLGKYFDFRNIQEVTTERPQGEIKASQPWDIDEKMRIKGKGNRCFFLKQPRHSANAGKIRALRDVSNWIADAMKQDGYSPDAVFQIDAETILEYATDFSKYPDKLPPPLKVMFNHLKRRQLLAVGTKDRFEPMDPETGKPLGAVRPATQEGYMLTNTSFITLPGGALLSQPREYIAGMKAITETVPGDIAEDYMYSKLLLEANRSKHMEDPYTQLESLNVVTHLNRCPQGKNAISQLERWRRQAQATDEIFPGKPYQQESLLRYTRLVISSRFKHALSGDLRYVAQLLKDMKEIPSIWRMLSSTVKADILNGSAAWRHNTEKRT